MKNQKKFQQKSTELSSKIIFIIYSMSEYDMEYDVY